MIYRDDDFIKTPIMPSNRCVQIWYTDLNVFSAVVVRAIYEVVAVENLSTNAGEKVARRCFASRFAAGAGAGCSVQTL